MASSLFRFPAPIFLEGSWSSKSAVQAAHIRDIISCWFRLTSRILSSSGGIRLRAIGARAFLSGLARCRARLHPPSRVVPRRGLCVIEPLAVPKGALAYSFSDRLNARRCAGFGLSSFLAAVGDMLGLISVVGRASLHSFGDRSAGTHAMRLHLSLVPW